MNDMNVNEAISTLRNAAWLGTNEERDRIEKAIDVVVGKMCFDAISRSEAIEELYKLQTYVFSSGEPLLVERKDVEWMLMDLSKVQPTTCIAHLSITEKQMEDIAKRALEMAVEEFCDSDTQQETKTMKHIDR